MYAVFKVEAFVELIRICLRLAKKQRMVKHTKMLVFVSAVAIRECETSSSVS